MRLLSVVLAALLASSSLPLASFAQTGFTTRTFPANDDTTLRVGDFNHDGSPDLLGYGGFTGGGGDIYLNDGSGGFKPPVALPVPSPANNNWPMVQAVIADMNGDGFPDIVACIDPYTGRGPQQDSLQIYLNDGTGNFTLGQNIALKGACTGLAVGDVNLDGHQDIVVASSQDNGSGSFTNYFQTYFGDGTGKLGTPVTTSGVNLDIPSTNGDTGCIFPNITGGNFYLDNQFSLIVNSRCYPTFSTQQQYGTTFLAHGDGTGHFTFTQSNAPIGQLSDPQTTDLNQDGRPDGLFLNNVAPRNSNIYTAINNGSGNFTYNKLFSSDGYAGVVSADLNGDGIPDLAASYISSGAASNQTYGPGTISIYTGSKSGAFSPSQSLNVGSSNSSIDDIAAADFNGDGKTDLATLVTNHLTGGSVTTTLYVFTSQGSSSSSCSAPSTANSNIICAPAKGATVSSPVTVTAASNVTGFTANRLYLDNKSVYQTSSQTVNTSITAGVGSHTLVLVSYNNKGQAFTSNSTFTVSSTACLPSGPGAVICSPNTATATSPVTITAGAIAQAGNITAMRAYIDNVAVFTVNNSSATNHQQVSQSAAVAPGAHHLVVVGYQSTGGAVTTSFNFTVPSSQPCYPSGAGAMICSPTNGSTVGTTFSLSAGATAGSGYITAVRAYLDNVAKTTFNNPNKSKSYAVTGSLTASPGKHNLTVVGYQSTGGAVVITYSINVQ